MRWFGRRPRQPDYCDSFKHQLVDAWRRGEVVLSDQWWNDVVDQRIKEGATVPIHFLDAFGYQRLPNEVDVRAEIDMRRIEMKLHEIVIPHALESLGQGDRFRAEVYGHYATGSTTIGALIRSVADYYEACAERVNGEHARRLAVLEEQHKQASLEASEAQKRAGTLRKEIQRLKMGLSN